MEELLGAILAGLAEFLLELIFRSLRNLLSDAILSPIVAYVFYLSLGCAFGAASLLLFPHPIFHPSRLHGISLLISPAITGLVMSQVGAFLRRKGKESVRIESFGYGFTFALGLAIIRLAFVR